MKKTWRDGGGGREGNTSKTMPCARLAEEFKKQQILSLQIKTDEVIIIIISSSSSIFVIIFIMIILFFECFAHEVTTFDGDVSLGTWVQLRSV